MGGSLNLKNVNANKVVEDGTEGIVAFPRSHLSFSVLILRSFWKKINTSKIPPGLLKHSFLLEVKTQLEVRFVAS